MNKLFRRTSALLLIACLAGCVGTRVTLDPDNRFLPQDHPYYAWQFPPLTDGADRNRMMVMLDTAIRQGLNEELQRRGYQLATAAQAADFVILYRFSRQPLNALDAANAASSDPTRAWVESGRLNNPDRPVQRYESFAAYEQGQLELRLETRDGKLLWRGQASRLIEDMYPQQQALNADIHRALRKLLRGFPVREPAAN